MSESTVTSKPRSLWERVLGAFATEFGGLHPRLNAYTFFSGLLVGHGSGELRARLLRSVGFEVGPGTVVAGTLRITGVSGLQRRLVIGAECWLGADVVLDLCERITIGERVTIEPGVMVLTSTHELDSPAHRAGPLVKNPVVIGDGALLRARSIILPGVQVGAGAVVDPGSVVNKDVAPNSRVGGSPAVQLELLAAKWTKPVILGAAAGLTAAVVLAVLAVRFFGGAQRFRFPYLGRPISSTDYDALAAKPGWSKARLRVAPGIELNGLVRQPASTEAPWVLFYPGNDESQLSRGQAFLERLGQDSPWGLAVFAYRGYDSSEGVTKAEDLGADAPEIFIQFCATQKIAASRVHIVGFSIGGYMAVLAARGAAARAQQSASLTLLASVNDIVMVRQSPWAKLSLGERLHTEPYLADVPPPVLVIQGDADAAFDGPGQGRAISAALGSRATYHELPGVGHVPVLSDGRTITLVREFVHAHAK